MQIKLRKVLALLSCLAMLCTLLPLGVFAEDGDLLTNGGFEDGSTDWTLKYGEVSSEDAATGTYSLKGTGSTKYYIYAERTVDVVPNSDYTITFKIKLAGDAADGVTPQHRMYVKDGDKATQLTVLYISDATADAWTTKTATFNSGNYTAINFNFAQGVANGGSCYIDDVTFTGPIPTGDEEVVEPSFDGYLYNGDFETGDANAWTVSGGEIEEFDGDYALKSTTTSKYSTVAEQTITVEANADYTLDVSSYYAGSDSTAQARVHIYAGSSGTTELASPAYYWTISAGAWDSHQLTFSSGEYTQVRIVLQQSVTTDGNIYYDDLVVTKVVPAPEGNDTASFDGYIYNGDFETGTLDYWTVGNGAQITYDTDNVASGNFALEGTATSKYDGFVTQTVTVEANTDYVITFKAKLAASGGQPRLVVNGNGVRLNNDSYYFSGSTEWQTFQASFNSGDNTSVDIVPTQGVTGGGNVYYDDIVMVKVESGAYVGLYPEEMTSGADIRFMTYNVLVGQDTEKGGYSWGSDITGRPEKASAMINYYKPDVIALEEFSGEWYDYFVENMTGYAFGEMNSNDASKNNGLLYTCLAYNTETVRLLDTALFQNTVSRWGTQGMRYVNVGFFEVIATGEKFIACATHPDAGALTGTTDVNGDGVAEEGDGYWRPQQLEEAAAYVAELSETYQMPVVWGGDFNSGLDGTYDDYVSWYKVADAGFTDATSGRYIDHIFYNSMATHLYETSVSDAAVAGASDHDAVFADIQFLDEYATPILSVIDSIKTQGRTYKKNGTLWLDFSASGVEFSANCEGTVALNLTVNSIKNTDATYGGVYFTVIVDGVQKDRAECRITETGNVELVLAEDLSSGNHTFEIYRQTEHRGAEIGISSIVMNGTLNEKPEDNRLYIEFVGDSISTGYGALGDSSASEQVDSPYYQDATVAYPYLTAKALNADFSDVAYSGIGAKYGYQSFTMQDLYPIQRYGYDTTTAYNFNTRQPDVVVIALGTNDIANQTDADLRKAGYQEMLDLVRAKNPNSKIVWIYGMMKDDDNTMIAELIEENGGGAEGLYSLELTTNTGGAGWHPTAAAQQVFADELVAFLNSDVLVKYVGDDMLDNDEGDVITLNGTSRMEMTSDKLGLAFRFQVQANGVAVQDGTVNTADLTNATIDAFGDGVEYKLVRMGAILSNDPGKGLADMRLDDVDNKKVLDVNATYLWDLEEDSAQFAVRITNIPLANEDTIIYARAYYVFEYEGREVIVYDDIQSANYVNKYDSNDGVLEW